MRLSSLLLSSVAFPFALVCPVSAADGDDTPAERFDAALEGSAEALIAGDAAKAGERFRAAQALLPALKDPEAGVWTLYEKRGDLLAQKERFGAARAEFAKALGPDGRVTATARLCIGRILRAEGDVAGALTMFATIGAGDPPHLYRAAVSNRAALLRGRYEKSKDTADLESAYALYAGLAASDPGDPDLREALSDTFMMLPEAARDRVPVGPELELARALAYIEKGDPAEALRRLDVLLARYPKMREGYKARAGLAKNPESKSLDIRVSNQLASEYTLDAHEFPKDFVPKSLHDDVRKRPYSSTPYIARARAILEKAKTPAHTDLAAKDARRAVLLDPWDPDAFAVSAEVSAVRVRLTDSTAIDERNRLRAAASAAADRALALAPDEAGLLMWRAAFAMEHDRFGDGPKTAIRVYTRLLRTDGDALPALLGRARAEVAAARNPEAERDYRRVLVLVPGHAEATRELDDLLSGRSDMTPLDAKRLR